MSNRDFLPIPPHFAAERVGKVWRVPYEERAQEARTWAQTHNIPPAAKDDYQVNLLLVDVQNTFCLPDFELFVGGRSGTAAVEDNRRLCEFIYRNLGSISKITLTMDTHQAVQIFHAVFLVDEDGRHPPAYTLVTAEDIESGRWRFNPQAAGALKITPKEGQQHLEHYAAALAAGGKFDLTIWPYHAMLGGIGNAIVPAVEEAVFFHSLARLSQPDFEVKGRNPLTEHYSAVGPEVLAGAEGKEIGERSQRFMEMLKRYDATLIAGQAKSHCVAATIADLLADIQKHDDSLAGKVFLLEDCTSPVVVPGVIDYTDQADAAYQRFAEAGMHLIRSTDPLETWYRG